ncbi:hypothetical protein TSUD_374130 [Trifolium subterraneum]|uniref:Uncharacterized protein n=1 Tax=Trifolium subterraneum TaxID=3900 RepID=A0A2Z6N885_TRISU|nr:hypothetical protein TSUD_374130 [Trifolium subterraneum]
MKDLGMVVYGEDESNTRENERDNGSMKKIVWYILVVGVRREMEGFGLLTFNFQEVGMKMNDPVT